MENVVTSNEALHLQTVLDQEEMAFAELRGGNANVAEKQYATQPDHDRVEEF